jgi:hypothetical protein
LLHYSSDTLIEKKITADVSLEGYVYLNTIIRDKLKDLDSILINKEDLIEAIREKAENDRITKKRVTQGIKNYCEMLNYDFKPSIMHEGKYYYKISKKTLQNQIII